jgi:AraC-like DNA-binding protein
MSIRKEDLEKASAIKAVIEKEYHKPFTIADLVQIAGSNKKTLSIAFKHLTGSPPIMYHREKRIEIAKQLLVNTDHSIEVIARRVGLDRSNLDKQFKKLTDKTPRQWRIQHQKNR